MRGSLQNTNRTRLGGPLDRFSNDFKIYCPGILSTLSLSFDRKRELEVLERARASCPTICCKSQLRFITYHY